MDNNEKALIYDECIRESDRLQRENSKIKSENPVNVPYHLQGILDKNNKRISELVVKLESLFK
jgi:hypothetical protein